MENLPLWMEGLNPELVRKANKELRETPETKTSALLELRKLINECPDLYCTEDDYFLTKFLRVKKYNVKRTFQTMKNYYEFKSKYPGVMTDSFREIINMDVFTVSPIRAPDGAIVAHINVGDISFHKFDVYDFFQAGLLMGEHLAHIEATQVCGVHALLDFKGIGLNKIRRYSNPKFLALLIRGVQNSWPVRLSSASLINEPFYVTIPINIVWPMLSKKIKDRIHFVGSNLENLHKRIPLKCLPEHLGGTLKIETLRKQRDIIISKQIEDERTNKYSFHRKHKKPVKKHSKCGLEENTSFMQNNVPIPKVTI